MSESHEMNSSADDAALERRLRGFRPVPPRLDRDRLMFLAGRRTVAPRRSRLWPAAVVASWTVSLALAGVLLTRPPRVVTEVRIVERIVEPPVAAERIAVAPLVPLPAERPVAELRRPDPSPLRPSTFAFGGATEGSLLDYRRRLSEGRDLFAAAMPPATPSRPAAPVPTYGELRREWLATGTLGDAVF